jgi:hypothetical protein
MTNHRVIWSFWDSELPTSVATVVFSWKVVNPAYEVRVLTSRSLPCFLPEDDFADIRSVRLRSDLIRLAILDEYGGVWLDTTVVLAQPLDAFVPWEVLARDGGLFAVADPQYSNPGKNDCVEPWALAAMPGSYIIQRWGELLVRVVRSHFLHHRDLKGISSSGVYDALSTVGYSALSALLRPSYPKYWQEYLVTCVTFKHLYHHDSQFQLLVARSPLDVAQRTGYLLQKHFAWDMGRVNAVLMAPLGKQPGLSAWLRSSKLLKLSTTT